ncbi:putative pre-peptidase [Cylindrospermum stagnale PCC 7417]|uniref:Putative pre-peptidase n=1 Tax=Cylindrospermum stagnale PCC 7417 TaxID=56107 RepID=K9WTL4_9NOST|nr:pre-peptidase C-terminal domain-containing protein [Cylindrospermum stagnale]AFZ23101.1 putative pre-peptidase [Cylindrospermum stagnale PCC 7417]
MSLIQIGSLSSAAVTKNDFSLSAGEPDDVFQFQIGSTRNINLALTDISASDNADLRLYRDNGDGIFNASTDPLIQSAGKFLNDDEAINVRADAGTYFAQVQRYDAGSQGGVTYDLALSATAPGNINDFSNLLPTEVELGFVSSNATRTGNVSNSNTADVYHFTLGLFTGANISLTGISSTADADIRLIQDINQNGIVDAGEELRRSTNNLGQSEFFQAFGTQGNGEFLLQVNQYSGTTNYTLNIDVFDSIGIA